MPRKWAHRVIVDEALFLLSLNNGPRLRDGHLSLFPATPVVMSHLLHPDYHFLEAGEAVHARIHLAIAGPRSVHLYEAFVQVSFAQQGPEGVLQPTSNIQVPMI